MTMMFDLIQCEPSDKRHLNTGIFLQGCTKVVFGLRNIAKEKEEEKEEDPMVWNVGSLKFFRFLFLFSY